MTGLQPGMGSGTGLRQGQPDDVVVVVVEDDAWVRGRMKVVVVALDTMPKGSCAWDVDVTERV
jgi:hypothetical protein